MKLIKVVAIILFIIIAVAGCKKKTAQITGSDNTGQNGGSGQTNNTGNPALDGNVNFAFAYTGAKDSVEESKYGYNYIVFVQNAEIAAITTSDILKSKLDITPETTTTTYTVSGYNANITGKRTANIIVTPEDTTKAVTKTVAIVGAEQVGDIKDKNGTKKDLILKPFIKSGDEADLGIFGYGFKTDDILYLTTDDKVDPDNKQPNGYPRIKDASVLGKTGIATILTTTGFSVKETLVDDYTQTGSLIITGCFVLVKLEKDNTEYRFKVELKTK